MRNLTLIAFFVFISIHVFGQSQSSNGYTVTTSNLTTKYGNIPLNGKTEKATYHNGNFSINHKKGKSNQLKFNTIQFSDYFALYIDHKENEDDLFGISTKIEYQNKNRTLSLNGKEYKVSFKNYDDLIIKALLIYAEYGKWEE